MYLFSRVVFAFVGLMVGSLVGITAAVMLTALLLRNSDGAPGDGMLLILLTMLGASLGAVLGLAAGLVLPITYGRKQNRPKGEDVRTASDEQVWPPPPRR